MSEKISKKYCCHVCGWMPSANEPDGDWGHCPNCLSSKHEIDEEGFACGGTLESISVWVKSDDTWEIIRRCRLCGEITATPLSEDDNPLKLLSITSKALSTPPFPIEKIEELTAMMGGRGNVGGYYHESGK